ncbi:GGDEF domain-containing protein [Ciceribacter sp. L1K22]|uniref:GGDEF domain-containing protein n=1 Tax=Ciceribacter sp. L1K22 TaxID=2820275 RepID=UPI001ABE528F|nr:GGDEF domain-containing protein [Ciceribacter sp. L1K22]
MKRLNKWFSLKVDLAEFERRGGVRRFALKMAFRAVLLSFALCLVVLPVNHVLGLAPDFSNAVLLSVLFSWLIGGAVSGLMALALGSAMRELTLSRARFERLSRTDMLSGLLNRRAFSELLAQGEENASLAIFDLDRFKAINDRHGHLAGDTVIRSVATAIREVFGAPHVAARLGGEEFGVVIRGGDMQSRIELVERVRQRIAEQRVAFEDVAISTTISVGVAEFGERRGEIVYSSADRALYLAKAAGRNRVVHESELALSFRRDEGEAGSMEVVPPTRTAVSLS